MSGFSNASDVSYAALSCRQATGRLVPGAEVRFINLVA